MSNKVELVKVNTFYSPSMYVMLDETIFSHPYIIVGGVHCVHRGAEQFWG